MTYRDPVYKNWLITMGGYTTAFVAQFFFSEYVAVARQNIG